MLSGRRRLTAWLLARCGATLRAAATDKSGLGPVTLAARHGWWDLMEQLLGLVADTATVLNTRSKEGETALGWVLKYGAAGLLAGEELLRLVSLLLERGSSPVLPLFREQIPPPCLAAATGQPQVLAALRSRHASLDPDVCRDSCGRSVLHYAAAKGHEEMGVLLQSELGAEECLTLTDEGGNTPIHLAAQRGHDDVARALLQRCADPSAAIMTPNGAGVTVYHLFLRAGPKKDSQEGVLWSLEKISAEQARMPIKVRLGWGGVG
ncbi:ANK17 protein [Gonium pectorale]|uniref:ANK17 protein n=1 Tax=Gonium pectorale TaxID=33097 RepID=A0A150H4M2_GONPE|nr:ANK17 protein [Gonium pectorale]|eukprot:KXZ57086.1 ANK17 protein [Gonium pectorale]